MRSKCKFRIVSILLTVMLLVTASPLLVEAKGVHLNKSKITITEGDTAKLKVSGTNGKIKWSSSKSSVATINQKGVIKAKNEGTAIIKAKIDNKVLKCKVTVEAEDDEWDDEDLTDESSSKGNTPLESVKSHIKNYGSTNANGDPIIQMESGDTKYTIIYDQSNDRLEFSLFMMGYVAGVSTIDTVHIDCPSDMRGTASIEESMATGIGSYSSSGTLEVATYKGGTDAVVTIDSSKDEMAALGDAKLKELTQSRVETLMVVIDVLLHNETGYYLKDIGFESFS